MTKNEGTHSKVALACAFAALSIVPRSGFSQSLTFGEALSQLGSVELGKGSLPKVVAISNASTAPVLIQEITTTQDFSESNNCPTWLAEGSGCLVFVSFTPVVVGHRSGQLIVKSVSVGEQSTPLRGEGSIQRERADEGAVEAHPPTASRTENRDENSSSR
jgi:hypothetical protein